MENNDLYIWGMLNERIYKSPNLLNIKVKIKNVFYLYFKISCGDRHIALLDNYNNIFTCGYGMFGRLGHGNEDNYENPKKIEYFDKILNKNEYICKVSCGSNHTVCFTSFNDIYSWGFNNHRQCGFISPKIILLPKKIPYDISGVKDISCGHNHTLISTFTNEIYSFGLNRYGVLGVINKYGHDCDNPLKVKEFKSESIFI